MDKLKVLLINGSPHEKGCTWTALCEISDTLKKNGVDSETYWLGNKPISGCIGCYVCRSTGKCFINDQVNDFVEYAKDFDGYIFGSPVHYAGISGGMTSFMDRVFFSQSSIFVGKPAAAIVSARRAGTTAALDQFNKYFPISGMPIVPSTYWNMVHGAKPEDVKKDLEGMQIMRMLAKNMVWMLKAFKLAADNGIKVPFREPREATNFIR